MTYSAIQSNSRYDSANDTQVESTLLSAATIYGYKVCNMQDEKLGNIQDVMLDVTQGKIRYAVMATGGFMGMRDRLYAVPWKALKQDKENQCFMLDLAVERLKSAPCFNRDQWPNMADTSWHSTIESYYAR